MDKKNCWEHFNCGREPEGENEGELGTCPASTETRIDGTNAGTNGGRACWAVTKTLCGSEAQGNIVEKMSKCLECEFRKLVLHEEGVEFKTTREILEMMQKTS
ncbi:MAG: hypothetical protein C0616_01535 [Desulfuromonas sp.]|nr:MAG: hypothetical protein C0616_01535 [Desulfuromonas sp.]